jgi:hypothetical protein
LLIADWSERSALAQLFNQQSGISNFRITASTSVLIHPRAKNC